MKIPIFAFIVAQGLVAHSLDSAANLADNGNAIYERDLAVWNGAGPYVRPIHLHLLDLHRYRGSL